MKQLLLVSLFFLTVSAFASDAMWVYDTDKLMGDEAARDELFTFCKARQITDLFWGTHYERTASSMTIPRAPEVHAFLRAASVNGLRVHALSGDPSQVLPSHYDHVLARVDATMEFNHAVPVEERFAGVHFDIEPHGLAAWKDADVAGKCQLLTQLVEVNAKAAERLHSVSPGMLYGADITFWFDKTTADGVALYPVTYNGVTKDATKHLLDFADNVGIMSYRNQAEGKNGLISIVKRTLDYADTARGRAYVGVKMAKIGPPMEGFYGQTEEAMQKALQPVRETFAGHRGYAGIAYFMYEAYREMPVK